MLQFFLGLVLGSVIGIIFMCLMIVGGGDSK